MKLSEAIPKITSALNVRFKDLYKSNQLVDIKINKGNTGKLLEKLIGLPPGNSLRDFEDGELKTNKCDAFGNPIETVFISQISKRFDDLVDPSVSFEESWIYHKIKRLLYVPVDKSSPNPENWKFLDCIFLEISEGSPIYIQLEEDFEAIKSKIKDDITKGDGFIHTSSGKYIEVRTKDSLPYSPIYSNKYSDYISDKNYAFYFKKAFVKVINPV